MWKPDGFPLFVPGVMQTPAAHAREEAAAYRLEIAALRDLLTKAEAKCEIAFTGVTISCKVPRPPAPLKWDRTSRARSAVIRSPRAGPSIPCRGYVRRISGWSRSVDKPWHNDCVAKGSAEEARRARILSSGSNAAGWMCVYDDSSTPPTVIIRNFRVRQCSPRTEQTFARPVTRHECNARKPSRRRTHRPIRTFRSAEAIHQAASTISAIGRASWRWLQPQARPRRFDVTLSSHRPSGPTGPRRQRQPAHQQPQHCRNPAQRAERHRQRREDSGCSCGTRNLSRMFTAKPAPIRTEAAEHARQRARAKHQQAEGDVDGVQKIIQHALANAVCTRSRHQHQRLALRLG